MKIINELNKKMNDFYKSWEYENTEEQFIALSAELETTQELEANIARFQKMTDEIEAVINDENNFESITENWDSVDQSMLDVLISTFEIDIETFANKVSTEEVRNEIKDFILRR